MFNNIELFYNNLLSDKFVLMVHLDRKSDNIN